MLTHPSLSNEGLILSFLLIAEWAALGLLMRNLPVDRLVLQSLKPQVALDFDVIGKPFSPPLGIEDAFIVGLPRIGDAEDKHRAFWSNGGQVSAGMTLLLTRVVCFLLIPVFRSPNGTFRPINHPFHLGKCLDKFFKYPQDTRLGFDNQACRR
jgi:hypothetical protein